MVGMMMAVDVEVIEAHSTDRLQSGSWLLSAFWAFLSCQNSSTRPPKRCDACQKMGNIPLPVAMINSAQDSSSA